MANSIPKSGTHLLVQALEAFPASTNYDSFIDSLSRGLDLQADCVIRKRIERTVPGELVSGHLRFQEKYVNWLNEKNIAHFFIYRDPRDVSISEAHYLTHMHRWLRPHHHFAHRLNNDRERICVSIRGIPRSEAPYVFPDINERFKPFLGWLNRNDTFSLKFEDLVGPERDSMLRAMASFFNMRTGKVLDIEQYLARAKANIDPTKSRTFRIGRPGSWKKEFSPEQKILFKEVAGPLLITLGYEKDMEW